MAQLFGHALKDGSTLYVSRTTGVRFIITNRDNGEISLYADGRFIFRGDRRTTFGLMESFEAR